MKTIDDLSRRLDGRRVLRPRRPQRAAEGGADHRRRPHPRLAADDRAARRRRRPVIVASHLGRPKGEPDPQFSLAPVAARLAELLAVDVASRRHRRRSRPRPPSLASPTARSPLLENVRFDAGETSKDDAERGAFAAQLAALADVYVNDAFGAVHREHASVVRPPARLPHAAG